MEKKDFMEMMQVNLKKDSDLGKSTLFKKELSFIHFIFLPVDNSSP